MPPINPQEAGQFKRPVSVLVVIYTAASEVLMLRRRQPSDYWQSVTGSLLPDESPFDAACREVREETGIEEPNQIDDCNRQNTFPIIEPWKSRYSPEDSHNTEHVFRLRLNHAQEVRISPDEHAEYRWVHRDTAAKMAGSYTNSTAILELTT